MASMACVAAVASPAVGLPSLTVARTQATSYRLNNAFFGRNVAVSKAPLQQKVARPFTVEAANYQVVEPLNGDPFVGGFETPVTSSPAVAYWLSNLPAYRTNISPVLRGVEVGLAHGFLLAGPFIKTGPLRDTDVAAIAGSAGAAGLVTILSVCLTIYGIASFKEGAPSAAPSLTLTGRAKEADKLQTAEGWASFAGGFFFGGLSGVTWAYLCLTVFQIPYPV
eukprot:TRINITY_DN319_c0_g1_i1.p1 TRINITY_DN319_c0_g1~~TRINITY_DN319_c0_g1_i1.p1  ORF type:complete len:223 (-),score=49.85 TRINITY_DN319_c0_g1_i1:496-1164(-)